MSSPALRHLFRPLAIGPVELPNRIVSTAHQTTLVDDHLPTEDFIAYHEARARGGVGLIILEATAVHPTGLLTAHTLAGYREEIIRGYATVAAAVQPHGTRLFVQLFHAGREQIATAPRAPTVAPSAVPTQRFKVTPRALRDDEIDSIVKGYAKSAAYAADAGVDGVEVTAAQGYLIAQFFTPELNGRTDRWGHPEAFLLAVVAAVREAAPRLGLGVRLSGDSPAARGVVHHLRNRVDYVHVAYGDSSTYRGSTGIVPPPPIGAEVIAGLTESFRVGPPVVATSRIADPVVADRLIREDRADAVGMTRALITDPDLPCKAREGRLDDILRCIGCNACIAHYHAGTPIACAQNPRTGRERRWHPPEPTEGPARLVIVGAGPAGLAAAAEAGAAGHEVVLLERSNEIGGQASLAGRAPAHAELAHSLRRNYDRLLETAGVELRLGVDADADAVASFAPDAVVAATGARPYEPSFPVDGMECVQAWEILTGPLPEGRRVVVADWGGDPAGLDSAELLAGAGNDVTVAVASVSVGETVHQYARNEYLGRLYRGGVRIEHHVELAAAREGVVSFRNLFAPELGLALPADLLVLALGRVPVTGIAEDLRARGVRVVEAGDCLSPRSLEEAILEGTLAGRDALAYVSASVEEAVR
ncbi:MAG: FAD-dependent oxidoreductase [Actinomycetota bacterium]|nr:FAD-dependent oxidoreductase [Actinomycetota bacterium]